MPHPGDPASTTTRQESTAASPPAPAPNLRGPGLHRPETWRAGRGSARQTESSRLTEGSTIQVGRVVARPRGRSLSPGGRGRSPAGWCIPRVGDSARCRRGARSCAGRDRRRGPAGRARASVPRGRRAALDTRRRSFRRGTGRGLGRTRGGLSRGERRRRRSPRSDGLRRSRPGGRAWYRRRRCTRRGRAGPSRAPRPPAPRAT